MLCCNGGLGTVAVLGSGKDVKLAKQATCLVALPEGGSVVPDTIP